MTRTEFEQCINVLRERADALLAGRRAAYAKEEDVLDNFRALADASALPMGQVWLVLAEKGRRALHKLMRGEEAPGEPPLDRFADALNYILLGWAIYQNPLAIGRPEPWDEVCEKARQERRKFDWDTERRLAEQRYAPGWPYSAPEQVDLNTQLGPGRTHERRRPKPELTSFP